MQCAVVASLVGCTSMSPPGQAPAFADRHPLHDEGAPQGVAVLASRGPTRVSLIAPFRTRAEASAQLGATGAAAGALAVYMLAPLALLAGPGGLLALPAIMGAGATIGLAAGVAAGADAVTSPQEAAASERLAQEAVEGFRLNQLTAQAVAGGVRDIAALRAEVVDQPIGDDPGSYRALRGRGFGAAVEVEVKEVGFDQRPWSKTAMSLFVIAQARLVDTSTGKATAQRGLLYVSPEHDSQAWSKDGAALTKAEIEWACATLAERIVGDLVLRVDGGLARLNAPPEFYPLPDLTCHFAPRLPKPRWRGGPLATQYRYLEAQPADSLTPMLAWERAPAADWGVLPPPWASASAGDATFDLRVWRALEGKSGHTRAELVYRRDGLKEPQHRVEQALEPGTTYFWSVRMRYVADGRAGATPWAAADEPLFYLPSPLGNDLHFWRVQQGELRKATCETADLTPCRCLDFIPSANYFRFRTP